MKLILLSMAHSLLKELKNFRYANFIYLSGLNFDGSGKCSGSFMISPMNGIMAV